MVHVALTLCILLVAPYTAVMGTEFIGSPNIDQWQRDLTPSHACNSKPRGALIADPDNCNNFFMCIGSGQRYPDSYSCKGGCFIIDKCETDILKCIGEGCYPISPPTPPPHNPDCTLKCSVPAHWGTYVYDKNSCSKYGICRNDYNIEPLTCTGNEPYFNGLDCGDDISDCCRCNLEECTATLVGYSIPDPHNCKQYYACANLNPPNARPTPVGPSICEDNGSFNPDTRECDPTITECDNACPAGDGGSTTTASTTIGGCINPADFNCPKEGYYASCPFCDPSYIKCDASNNPSPLSCDGGKVFNTNPAIPRCLQPGDCPYYP